MILIVCYSGGIDTPSPNTNLLEFSRVGGCREITFSTVEFPPPSPSPSPGIALNVFIFFVTKPLLLDGD